MTTAARSIRAPRGTSLTCKGWLQEAALRMLMNNLDPEVAERPEDLVVYGGTGRRRAAGRLRRHRRRAAAPRQRRDAARAVGQAGRRLPHHTDAPRVLIANANLVPNWATWETFRDLEDRGLTMYGQMTAGSWIYIGTQGILQGTYETLAALARRHFGGSLAGRLIVTAGLGGMGGAQPLAATMNERRRARRRGRSAPDRAAAGHAATSTRRPTDLDDGARHACGGWQPTGAGALVGAARQRRRRACRARAPRRHARCRHRSDVGARPAERLRSRTGCSLAAANALRAVGPGRVPTAHRRRDGPARRGDARAASGAARRLRLRQQHPRAGGQGRRRRRFRHSRLRARVHPSALLRRQGAVPLGRALGRSRGHLAPTSGARDVPDDEPLCRWIRLAGERVAFQGLPARICWLGYGERARFGLRFNELVAPARSRRRS